MHRTNFYVKYNSLIQVMNYLTMETGPQNLAPKFVNSVVANQMGQTKSILGLISLALSTDFSRYTSLINTKILLEELINAQNAERNASQLPSIPPHPQSRVKEPAQSASRPAQKKQPIKTGSTPKQSAPKAVPPAPSPALNPPVPEKIAKKATSEKVASPKLKKKIQKIPEAKKENPGRVPRVNMVQTAEIGRSRLGEKDKKKLKERLLVRQVREWPQAEECKRDRRQLRILH